MSAICPYCNSVIEEDPASRCFCSVCGTAHHTECWAENGGCTVFGCTAAPPDEPKVTVTASDFNQGTAAPPPPPPGGVSTVPPPPPPHPYVPPPANFTFGGYATTAVPPPNRYQYPQGAVPKNRTTYILLGIFLGMFGGHNFYAGYYGRAMLQILLSVLTLFVGSFIAWIWAIVEVCTVDRDSRNVQMV
jgi:hypothetical protein